jgi:hypothetical protein
MSTNTHLCKYCSEKMCLSIESTSLLVCEDFSPCKITNPNIISPCSCPELAHKSCLITKLRDTYSYKCNICSTPYNLNIIDIVGCFF